MKTEQSVTITKRLSTKEIYHFLHIAKNSNCDIQIFYDNKSRQKRVFIDFTTFLLSVNKEDTIILVADGSDAAETIEKLCNALSGCIAISHQLSFEKLFNHTVYKGDGYEERPFLSD